MAKTKARRKRNPVTYAEPTPERMAHATFEQGGNCATGQDERSGVAYRLIPVIDTMAQTGKLTPRQHYGLARYRAVALAEERSPMRDSLDKALHGRSSEQGLPPSCLRSSSELDRLKSVLGPLVDITHAVAVDDEDLDLWAIKKGGAIIIQRVDKKTVHDVVAPRPEWLNRATSDIKASGERLAIALGV